MASPPSRIIVLKKLKKLKKLKCIVFLATSDLKKLKKLKISSLCGIPPLEDHSSETDTKKVAKVESGVRREDGGANQSRGWQIKVGGGKSKWVGQIKVYPNNLLTCNFNNAQLY